MMTQVRPQSDEYAISFKKYVDVVPDGELVAILESQLKDWQRLLAPLRDEAGDFRYAPGKWSIKEVLGHVSDAERVFSYRLLRIARGDKTPLPGFEQDDYIKTANSSSRRLMDLREEFEVVRRSSLALVSSLDEEALRRTGTASGNPVSARAMVFVIAGHDRHHWQVLREKYSPALGEQ
jgi:uncharacterized damage-inducible protein DinB